MMDAIHSGAPTSTISLVMHDVSPSTWVQCEYLIDTLRAVAPIPVTYLVVPNYHTGRAAREDRHFNATLNERMERGDELALHGLTHRDDQPLSGIAATLLRRSYTAGEGEFSALNLTNARERIERGCAYFEENGWPLNGFVAPAWLMSRGTWDALRASPFKYTSSLREVFALPSGHAYHAPSLVFSTRAAWRRGLSHLWADHIRRSVGTTLPVRLGLHPSDARHPSVVAHWRALLSDLIRDREAITKVELVRRLEAAARAPSYLDRPDANRADRRSEQGAS